METQQASMTSDLSSLQASSDLIKGLPMGAERDAAVHSMGLDVEKIGANINHNAQSQARFNADSAVGGDFKRSRQDITDETDQHRNQVDKILDETHAALQGDPENQVNVKKMQEIMLALLTRLKEMIKNIFSGFQKGPSAAPAPRP